MLVVLVQNPKGGGLGAGFGGGASNAMGGVQRTTDFLEKATWGLAIALLVLSLFSYVFLDNKTTTSGAYVEDTEAVDLLKNE